MQEAAERFNVTEETIRRDLRALESQGLIICTPRGAALADDIKMEVSLEIREGINIEGKNIIGRLASSLVKDGDTPVSGCQHFLSVRRQTSEG